MDLTVKKTAENGLQTATSSHCLRFQEQTADIQEALSILMKMFIILKEGNVPKYKEFQLFLSFTPFSPQLSKNGHNTILIIVAAIIKLDASSI